MDFFTTLGPDGEPILEQRWLFAGVPSLAVGLSRNCFGDANSLVRRSAFDAVGGFTEDHGVTHEDWEFFVRVAMHGLNLEIVPEALFWYRIAPDSMIRSTPRLANYARHLRPILDEVPEAYRDVIRLAQGLSLRETTLPAPVDRRPLRYDIADAINARLKKLGPLHEAGRRLIGRLVRLLGGDAS
jgi:GT2 family glycosyltransferase